MNGEEFSITGQHPGYIVYLAVPRLRPSEKCAPPDSEDVAPNDGKTRVILDVGFFSRKKRHTPPTLYKLPE